MDTPRPVTSHRRKGVLLAFFLSIIAAICIVLYLDEAKESDISDEIEHNLHNLNDQFSRQELSITRKIVTQMEFMPTVIDALLRDQPKDTEASRLLLGGVATGVNGDVVYVMNSDGLVVAASRYGKNKTFFGRNFRFRPYFTNAIQGQHSLYGALGILTKKRGMYFSGPIHKPGSDEIIGVGIIKIGLEKIDGMLEAIQHPVALTTPSGIIFATNRPSLLFRSIKTLTDKEKKVLEASRQFGDTTILNLPDTLDDAGRTFPIQDMRSGFIETQISGWQLWGWRAKTFPTTTAILLIVAVSGFFFSTETLYWAWLQKQESKRRLLDAARIWQGTYDAMDDEIAMLDSSLTVIQTNKAISNRYGQMDSGLSYRDFLENCNLEEFSRIMRSWNDSPEHETVTCELHQQKPETRWVELFLTPLARAQGEPKMFIHVCRDINSRKIAARKLQKEHEELQNILEAIPIGVIICDEHFTIRWFNRCGRELMRCDTGEQLLSKQCNMFFSHQDQAQSPLLFPDVAWGSRGIEALLTPCSGDPVPVLVTKDSVEIHDAKQWLIAFIDLSEHKTMEHELLQARKLEAVGQLASGIAHEINTPAQFISGNLDFMEGSVRDLFSTLEELLEFGRSASQHNELKPVWTEVEKSLEENDIEYILDELPESIQQSLEGIRRISKIVLAMKEFAHPSPTEGFETVDLNKVIENTIIISTNEWKLAAELNFQPAADLPKLEGRSDELSQVFLNLIVNSVHAIEDRFRDTGQMGTISITTTSDEKWCIVEVIDNGGGIPASVQDRIFDPFFTTKDVGKGSGQGLSIARATITKKHQGEMECTSEEGAGTTFTIRLPRIAPARTG